MQTAILKVMHVVYSRLFLRVASVTRGKWGDYRIVGEVNLSDIVKSIDL